MGNSYSIPPPPWSRDEATVAEEEVAPETREMLRVLSRPPRERDLIVKVSNVDTVENCDDDPRADLDVVPGPAAGKLGARPLAPLLQGPPQAATNLQGHEGVDYKVVFLV